MPQRLDEFNKRFIYTETNPENIIGANKGAIFCRRGDKFYVNPTGNAGAEWHNLGYRTVIIPPPAMDKLIRFRTPNEVWVKTTDGFYNERNELMPKTGWKFYSYEDAFSQAATSKLFHWIFPPPASSNDPSGVDGQRSYDNNFFYAKISGLWFRSPISIYNEAAAPSADNPTWTNNLPYADMPRYYPVPPNSSYPGIEGDQTYDAEFFYVNPSSWKRVQLLVFTGINKMTKF